MEALFALGLIIFVFWLIGAFFSLLGNLIDGVGRSKYDSSIDPSVHSEIEKLERKRNPAPMRKFELRLHSEFIGDKPNRIKAKCVQVRGLFPLTKIADVRFLVSVFDQSSDGELVPVFSALEEFQEPGGVAFQSDRIVSGLKPGYGYPEWVTVGLIIPDFLIAPQSGRRSLQVFLRMVDAKAEFPIRDGLSDPRYKSSLLWVNKVKLDVHLKEKGYVESEQDQLKARLLAVRLAIAVSMSDGLAHPKEAQIVKEWVARHLELYSPQHREKVKQDFNQEVQNAFSASKDGTLDVKETCQEIDKLGLVASKYEAMELCYDVMAADGVAAKEELQALESIARALDLDEKKLETIRDKRMTGLNLDSHTDQDAANVLGIQPGWSPEKIKSHLRKEFTKWNNRLTVLPEGEKREQAQKMLDLIGRERKKYE